VGMKGHGAQVLLIDGHADPRTQWVFGRHPYPPTA
jgi:hypothetical protein